MKKCSEEENRSFVKKAENVIDSNKNNTTTKHT